MNDNSTTFSEMKDVLRAFNEKRQWSHNALNTAISISLEASELLELFQWCDRDEADRIARETGRERFLEELSDVLIYCMDLAIAYDVDIASAIGDKLRKNAQKYPETEI